MAEKVVGFRIEIKGTSAQVKKLGDLKVQILGTQTDIKKLTEATKGNTGAQKAARETFAVLETKLKTLRGEYSKQQRPIIANQKAINASSKSYDKLVAETGILRQRLRALPDGFNKNNKAASALAKTIARNEVNLKKFDARIGQNFRNVGNYTEGIKRAGAGFLRFAAGITAGVIGFRALTRIIGGTVKIIKDFQQANANLAAVLGKSRSEIIGLTEDAKRLGATTAFTASQVVELQVEFAKLGFNEEEILAATEATLDLAAATGTDLANAASVSGSVVRAFGLDASETQRVVDVMAKSFSSTSLDIDKFSTAISSVAPVAASAGVSIERTTALLGTLTDRGVDASTAGTGLRNVFLELSKRGLTFEEAMAKINTATDRNAAALELFGKRGATVGQILAATGASVDDLTEAFENAGGAAERMAEEQLDTLTGRLTILNSTWEGLILSLEDGEGALGRAANAVIEFATGVLRGIQLIGKSVDEISQDLGKLEADEGLQRRLDAIAGSEDKLAEATFQLKDVQEILSLTTQVLNEDLGGVAPTTAEANKAMLRFGEGLTAADVASRSLNDRFEEQRRLTVGLIARNNEIVESLKAVIEQEKIAAEVIALRGKNLEQLNFIIENGNKIQMEAARILIQELTKTEAAQIEAALAGEERDDKAAEKAAKAAAKRAKKEEADRIKRLEGQLEFLAALEEANLSANEAEEVAIAEKFDKLFLEAEKHEFDKAELRRIELELIQQQEQAITELKRSQNQERIKDLESAIKAELDLELEEVDRAQEQALLDIEQRQLNKEEENALILEAELAFEEERLAIKEQFGESDIQLKRNIEQIKAEIDKNARDAEIKRFDDATRTTNDLAAFATNFFQAQKQIQLNAAGDNAEKREQIEKKFAEKARTVALIQAAINGFLAITKAISLLGPPPSPAGIAGIAAAIATTALNIAAISSKSFNKGGVLKGASHNEGGIPFTVGGVPGFEAAGGESIINARSTKMFRSQLSAINVAGGGVSFGAGGITRFQEGAAIPISAAPLVEQAASISSRESMSEFAQAIVEGINDKKVIQVEEEVTEIQGRVLQNETITDF